MSSCLFEANVELERGRITLLLPIKTISEGNCSEHWQRKAKRHRQQQGRVQMFMCNYRELIKLPCTITVTRIAPRNLDFDNFVYGQKWVVDAICDQLVPGLRPGRADADERIKINYKQEKGAPKFYATRVMFEF